MDIEQLKFILDYRVGENTVHMILQALGVFALLLVIFKIIASRLIKRFKKFAQKTKSLLDDKLALILEETQGPFGYIIAIYTALKMVILPYETMYIIDAIFLIASVYYVIRAIRIMTDYALNRYFKKENESTRKTIMGGLNLIINLVLWASGLLLILANLGVEVTSLVASLGIGGIAVALAAQHILTDLFSSFLIYFDKPFEVGDYIVIGEDSGTVIRIGLKTTRLQALRGDELIIPNSDIVSKNIHNYKKMKKRRINFSFGVTYDTPNTKLKKISTIIKKIIDKNKNTEYFNVSFKEFGDFALIYEVIYYVSEGDYLLYLKTQEYINLAIREEFKKAKIEMAFPTQTLYIKK